MRTETLSNLSALARKSGHVSAVVRSAGEWEFGLGSVFVTCEPFHEQGEVGSGELPLERGCGPLVAVLEGE